MWVWEITYHKDTYGETHVYEKCIVASDAQQALYKFNANVSGATIVSILRKEEVQV